MIIAASYQPIDGDTVAEVSGTAVDWPVSVTTRETEEGNSRGPGIPQAHLDCVRCKQSILTLAPDISAGAGYVFSLQYMAAATLRHIREVHCDGGGILLDK